MTEPAAPHGTASTLPPPAANGSAPSPPAPPSRPRLWLRIPIESDHLFRSNPIADSGVSDHLAGVGVS